MTSSRPGPRRDVRITAYDGDRSEERSDRVVTEEPLEIRLQALGRRRTVAVTMRTPGSDFELAAGFLHSEGILDSKADLGAIRYCVDRDVDEEQRYNIVTVDMRALPDLPTLERHFMTSSACGVCGSAVIGDLSERGVTSVDDGLEVKRSLVYELPDRLSQGQRIFDETGGLHAAGLFDPEGHQIVVREDVGRHNAVDKVVGLGLLEDKLPLEGTILAVSGRAGFEIVQKAIVARIPLVAAVSAPSSLAVELARAFGVTLIGFLRGDRMNVYSHPGRILG